MGAHGSRDTGGLRTLLVELRIAESMKVAIVHDWFCNIGGAEECVKVFTELFPGAPIYTLVVYDRNWDLPLLKENEIHTSFVQKLPFAGRRHQEYLPLYPTAIEQFDLTDYDLVVSSSSSVAKGAITRPETCHICYCYTPMRYAWHLYHEYLGGERFKWLKSKLIPPIMSYIRTWDVASSQRVDHFVAISNCVAQRIRKYYQREAAVIHPPVDTDFYTPGTKRYDFFVTVGRLVAYKNVDKIIHAFNRLKAPLKVVGTGPEAKRLASLAGPSIEMVGYQSRENVRELLRAARAFVFAAEEDFGIAPLEAQSCGTPVIAYGRGGSLETVVGGVTGAFFTEKTPESIEDAVRSFEAGSFDAEAIRRHALTFNRDRFKIEFGEFCLRKLADHKAVAAPSQHEEVAPAA
jgi:glycosyltransferase involved in cell wall biosynthesis